MRHKGGESPLRKRTENMKILCPFFLTSTAFVDTKAKPRARRGEKSFQLFQNGFELIGISDSIKLFFRKPFVAENFAKRVD